MKTKVVPAEDLDPKLGLRATDYIFVRGDVDLRLLNAPHGYVLCFKLSRGAKKPLWLEIPISFSAFRDLLRGHAISATATEDRDGPREE